MLDLVNEFACAGKIVINIIQPLIKSLRTSKYFVTARSLLTQSGFTALKLK